MKILVIGGGGRQIFVDQGAWRVEATHPDSLLGMTWRWPSARFDRPEVLSGAEGSFGPAV